MKVLAQVSYIERLGWRCEGINPDFTDGYERPGVAYGEGKTKEEAIMDFQMKVAAVHGLEDFEIVKVRLI